MSHDRRQFLLRGAALGAATAASAPRSLAGTAKLPPDASSASGLATAERCDTYLFILLICCGATSRPAVDDEATADLGATPPAA